MDTTHNHDLDAVGKLALRCAALGIESEAKAAEIARLTRALAEADAAGKASFAAGYSAGQAEIARLQQQITDLNAAWRADRAIITGRPPHTRLDGASAVYELHEADKARYDPALPADLLGPEILAE